MGVFTRGGRAIDTALQKLILELLSGKADDVLLRMVFADLRSGKLLAKGFQRSIGDMEKLIRRIAELLEKLPPRQWKVAGTIGKGLADARKNPLRAEYLRYCDRLREFALTADFDKLIDPRLAPTSRAAFDAFARAHFQKVSGVVAPYDDIKRESYMLNALSKRLYPGQTDAKYRNFTAPTSPIYQSLRLDAQHIVEQASFEKFKKDWKLLGWNSTGDMPAVAVMHEWHIRTPKNLAGLEDARLLDATPVDDIFSLTKQVQAAAPIDKCKTAEEYLRKLREFYGFTVKNKQGRDIQPLRAFADYVAEIEKALKAAKSGK